MKVVVFGANGQLGKALQETGPDGIELVAVGSLECDVCDPHAVEGLIEKVEPDILINAAAYTAVDRAETEVDAAFRVNGDAPRVLASLAARHGLRLIHVSTDFVFDGVATQPIKPAAQTDPVNVYGRSKLAGEQAVLEEHPRGSVIIRTSWLYGAHGSNFVKTILRLLSEKDQLSVVANQIGAPTWSKSLAKAIWQFTLYPELVGVFHWSDAGQISWYEFAQEIQRQALELGLLTVAIPIHAITAAQYPTPAARPGYSVLDISATEKALNHKSTNWKKSLSRMLTELDH